MAGCSKSPPANGQPAPVVFDDWQGFESPRADGADIEKAYTACFIRKLLVGQGISNPPSVGADGTAIFRHKLKKTNGHASRCVSYAGAARASDKARNDSPLQSCHCFCIISTTGALQRRIEDTLNLGCLAFVGGESGGAAVGQKRN